MQVWCSLKSVTTTLCLLFSWLYTYTALHSSYHIEEPSLIPKLLLPCVYDTMIMQFYYILISHLLYIYTFKKEKSRDAAVKKNRYKRSRDK